MNLDDYLVHASYVGVTEMLETSLEVSMARHRLYSEVQEV